MYHCWIIAKDARHSSIDYYSAKKSFRNVSLKMHLIQTKLIWLHHFVTVGIAIILVLSLAYGFPDMALLLALLLVLYAALLFIEKRRGDVEGIAEVALVSLVIAAVIGEFGASIDSRFMYVVSVWKIGVVIMTAVFLIWDARGMMIAARRMLEVPAGKCFVSLILILLVSTIAQVFLGIPEQMKGVARALTFYSCLALAGCLFTMFLTRDRMLFKAKSAIRVTLIIFIVFSFVEMLANIHLPTSWLYSDDPNVLASFASIKEQNPNWRWVTATGLFYNPNNHCLFLALLAALSLPASTESFRLQIGSVVIACIALLVTSMLGATIVSLSLFVSIVVWSVLSKAGRGLRLVAVFAACACMLFLPDPLMIAFMSLVECGGGGAVSLVEYGGGDATASVVGATASVAKDFSVQADNYAQGGGSLWKRLTMYVDLVKLIVSNPLGIGAAGVQPYFTSHPSISGLVDPHNWWLEMAACYGWVSGVALVTSFAVAGISAIVSIVKTSSDVSLCIVSGLCVAALGSLAPSSCDFNVLVWLPVLLGVAICANSFMVDQENDENTSGNV